MCLMFFFGVIIPPFAGITSVGMSILGIFFGVLISTIATNEIFWPAILGLFAMRRWRHTRSLSDLFRGIDCESH